jgi:steroid delta-isomerase-like uncharacterized protein
MALTTDEIRELGVKWVDHWANHRCAEAMEYFAEDCVYVGPNRTFKGKTAIQAFVDGFFKSYPDEVWQLKQAYADGNTLILEWNDTGTMRAPWPLPGGAVIEPTGKTYDYPGCDVLKINDEGKIYYWQEYFDMVIMIKQLGIAEEFITGMPKMAASDTAENMLSQMDAKEL